MNSSKNFLSTVFDHFDIYLHLVKRGWWSGIISREDRSYRISGPVDQVNIYLEQLRRHIVLYHSWTFDDDCNIFMQCDQHQSCPSPLGMKPYESLDPSSGSFGSDVFMNHTNLHIPDSPCFSGNCIHCYKCMQSVYRNIYVTWAVASPGSLNVLVLELPFTMSVSLTRNQRGSFQVCISFNENRYLIGIVLLIVSRYCLTWDLSAVEKTLLQELAVLY